MARSGRLAVTLLVSLSLATQAAAPGYAQGPLSRADYDSCQARDEPSFRKAIETITVAALNKGLARIDYAALVAEQWRKHDLDEIIDKRVDVVLAEVSDETSTWDRLQSNWSGESAKLLAEKIAERVYRSDTVKAGLEALTTGVTGEIGKTIEIAAKDTVEPAITCLKAFLGARYGTSIADAAGGEFSGDALKATPSTGPRSVIDQRVKGVSGVAVLIARRQIANITARIGQRLVGTVLSRLVAIAADGLGLILIAWDLKDLWGGAFPSIGKEMKSAATKAKLQEELAKDIGEQIGDHVKEIGTSTADRVLEIWQEFHRAHLKVVDLAERNAAFKYFVDSHSSATLPRLDEVVALVVATEGEDGLLKRLGDGTLGAAVDTLPPAGMDIARETRSLGQGLAWSALAGDDLKKIVELELYRRTKPDNFSKAALQKVLGLGDRLAVTRMATLPPEARDALFAVETGDLKTLARSLTEPELTTLAAYLAGLGKEPRELILKAVAQSPAAMHAIAAPRVRDAILASRDQTAAVTMMLRSGPLIEPRLIVEDFRAGWEGRISPVLLADKHPGSLVAAGLAGLVLLSMVLRLLRPRRARETVKPAVAAK